MTLVPLEVANHFAVPRMRMIAYDAIGKMLTYEIMDAPGSRILYNCQYLLARQTNRDNAAIEPRILEDGRHFWQWQLDVIGCHVKKGMKIENLRWVPHREQFAWEYCAEYCDATG